MSGLIWSRYTKSQMTDVLIRLSLIIQYDAPLCLSSGWLTFCHLAICPEYAKTNEDKL